MPFPFTLGPNTYTRADFTSQAYATKFPRFLQDLATYVGPSGAIEVLSPIDFSLSALVMTVAAPWAVVGETLMVYHAESGSYAHVKVVSTTSTTITGSVQYTLPTKGTGTHSGAVLVRSVPPNWLNTPYALSEDVRNVDTRIYSEDFIERFAPVSGGLYTGDADVNKSLSDQVNSQLALDVFTLSTPLIVMEPAESSLYPGRGWARFKSSAPAPYCAGGYFAALTDCVWSQWCVIPGSISTRLYTGWQAKSTSLEPVPAGYPHEFVHGVAMHGPFVNIIESSDSDVEGSPRNFTVTVGHGSNSVALSQSLTNPLFFGNKPLTIELRTKLSDIHYRLYTDDVEVTGILPPPLTPILSGVFRPYFGGNGEYLVDYFWASSNV
jgi:hypothetical protein